MVRHLPLGVGGRALGRRGHRAGPVEAEEAREEAVEAVETEERQ